MKKMYVLMTGLMLSMLGSAAMAAIDTSDPFYPFFDMVQTWLTGTLGTGLAFLMVLIGAAMGIAKNSPLAALGGIALAAIIAFADNVILSLMGSGLVF